MASWNRAPLWVTQVMTVILLLGCRAETALAHREDFVDETLVYETLERGEFEPEYWFDEAHRSDPSRNFVRHNLAAEVGITEHWMIDTRATMQKEEGQALRFDSARLETRYRFFDESTLPMDIAVSGEVNVERDEQGADSFGIEPRLILSKDFQKLNLTLNLSEEVPFDSHTNIFNVSSGFRYDSTELFRFGSELKYDFADHEGALIPQLWFAFPHEITLKMGYSHGFDRSQENFFRVAFEKGF